MQNSYIEERCRQIPVLDHAEVVVVGGGPAGSAAAIAASRAGAKKVILIERYGHLGGMSTGGRVVLIPSLSYGDEIVLRGIILEAVERLKKIPNGICGPDISLLGSKDREQVHYWKKYLNMVWNDTVCYGGFTDPDLLKIILLELAKEAGVEFYFHCWGSEALVDNGCVTGVAFESKQGRAAVLADVVIDCTGDGDICASAGADFDYMPVGNYRNTSMGLVYRLGGADFDAYSDYKRDHPEEWSIHAKALLDICGFSTAFFPTSRNDIVWVDNWLTGGSSLKIKDLSQVEVDVTGTILPMIDYLKQSKIPGLKDVWLYDMASQIGTRGSRRIKGKTVLTIENMEQRTEYEDVVAVFPAVDVVTSNAQVEDSSALKPVYFPLRALIVEGKENLLVAGRAFSSDLTANNQNNLIPHCFAMGQAAGVLAACASKAGKCVSEISYCEVQRELLNQGVYLPESVKEQL